MRNGVTNEAERRRIYYNERRIGVNGEVSQTAKRLTRVLAEEAGEEGSVQDKT